MPSTPRTIPNKCTEGTLSNMLPNATLTQQLVRQRTNATNSGKKTNNMEEFYSMASEVGFDKAVHNCSIAELGERYPMMCFCSPEAGNTCRHKPDGHRGKVPIRRKVLWAAPFFGFNALKFMKIGWQKRFYVDDYPKASLGILAMSTVFSVVVDASTDPLVAVWTDRLRSKWGRRRPFLFVSAFLFPTIAVLGWTPSIVPSGIGASIWFGVFHVLFRIGETFHQIPHEAWGAQLTPMYEEKNTVWQTMELSNSLGIVVGMAAVPVIFTSVQGDFCVSTPGDGCWSWPVIATGFGLIYAAATLALVWKGRESMVFEVSQMQGRFRPSDIIPTLMATFRNTPFRILLISGTAKAVGMEVPIQVMPFMTASVLGEKCLPAGLNFGVHVLTTLAASLVGMLIWRKLADRFGKYKMFVGLHFAYLTVQLAFTTLQYDNGNCAATGVSIATAGFLGLAYGGNFLVNSLMADIVDYDEFLSGGDRREASYLMAIEFIPKLMSIPGEVLPLMLLSFLGYVRPFENDGVDPEYKCKTDTDCFNFYSQEPKGSNWCSNSRSCQEIFNDGIKFVCNNANETCGPKQNSDVRLALVLCFSVVPSVFVIMGLIALYWYPKEARSKEAQAALLLSISDLRKGNRVQDPWRPDNFVQPADPLTDNSGLLSYFTPSELKQLAETVDDDNDYVVADKSWRCPAIGAIVAILFSIPGIVIMIIGWKDLSSDLGASISPIGAMIVGICGFALWFAIIKFQAAVELLKRPVQRHEVIRAYNRTTPFTGAARFSEVMATE